MDRVVVGLDGSEGSRHALRWAVQEARRWQASLTVLSAWSYPTAGLGVMYGMMPPVEEMQVSQEEACREVLADEGLEPCPDDIELELVVVEGPAAPTLLDAATSKDLLVVGARGVGGFMGLLLGSVSQHCAAHASGPLVVVH
jgi:nucleotide-binding universal stress UspA family protein